MKPLIFGISGLYLTEEETNFFKQHEIYGFILFKRNIASKLQLQKLISELKALYPHREDLFISLDQEGGRVARLKQPLVEKIYPPAAYFSKNYDSGNQELSYQAVYDNYFHLMGELKTLGICCPYAPVADLHYEYTDNVIGDRSFGNDINMVVNLCSAAIKGINDNSGIAVIKHIPGHGRAICDSHYELPRITASFEELNTIDFEVFRQLANNEKVGWAMTAHVIFNALDPTLPVTLSPKAIAFIREEIGFKGTLITDAIDMLALHEGVDPSNKAEFNASLIRAAQKSLEAGCDLVLHCTGNIEEMIAIAEALKA